jgi:PsbP
MRTLAPILLITLAVACKSKDSGTPVQDTTASLTTTTTGTEMAISSTETAVVPEVNPPGDIPDSQAFVKYANTAGGYHLEVPEGWARTEAGADVTFVDKFDGVSVAVTPASAAPTAAGARTNEAKQIQSQGHAVTITNVSEVNLPGGKAVVIKYASNSDPNPVTNKRVRLENIAYIFYRNGKEATLTVWAPQGADNVDQWKRISGSFRWL